MRCGNAVDLIGLEHEAAPVNIGVVAGGRTVNSLADEARLLLERRSLDE